MWTHPAGWLGRLVWVSGLGVWLAGLARAATRMKRSGRDTMLGQRRHIRPTGVAGAPVQAALPCLPSDPLAGSLTFGDGMRMLVPQVRHRTVLPRQAGGTSRTFLHVRFGHMILRLVPASLATIAPQRALSAGVSAVVSPIFMCWSRLHWSSHLNGWRPARLGALGS